MTLTNFPNGVSSFGMPVLGGAGGVPFTGNYYFVDYVNGSDGAEGTADDPLKTLDRAHDLCTSGNNDVVFIVGNGETDGSARLSETLVWSKSATHLIGITAPTRVAQRARIAAASGVTGFTPLVKVTGDGCMFANFSVFQGYDTAEDQNAWLESGQRNYYFNVHFGGMGHQTPADRAGSRSIVIDGGVSQSTTGLGEHTFENCVFGLDTVDRGAANASLALDGATPRNTFRNCTFICYADAATALHVTVAAASDIDRWQLFDRCQFINTGTQVLTAAMYMAGSAGGYFLLDNCVFMRATDIEAAASNQIFIMGPVPTAATTALSINNA